MKMLNDLVFEAIADFRAIGELAHAEFKDEEIRVETLAKPHVPPKVLPKGRVAVYAFFLNGQALKVGIAGSKSAARYTSQHYNPKSAKSNLAKSILSDPEKFGLEMNDSRRVGDWIKEHSDRVNLLLPANTNLLVINLLEAFLHVRWKPVFEGRPEIN